MEARKIVIVSTKTQKKQVIMSAATTLGELKEDLRANNIDYDNMDFYEGTAKVQLKTDESVLPHDVPYKGTITNELVFMLTTMNKKIRSGILMSRAETYTKVKSLGIQEEIKKKYGKNFTQCSTADLINLIEGHMNKADEKEAEVETKEEPIKVESEMTDKEVDPVEEITKQIIDEGDSYQELLDIVSKLTERIDKLEQRVKTLEDNNSYEDDYECEEEEEEEEELPYSNDDIDDMFDFVK